MEYLIRAAILGYCVWATQDLLLAQDAEAIARSYSHFVEKGGDRHQVQDAPLHGVGVAPPAETAPAPSIKPSVTIRVAPFYCPPCNTVKGYDWSAFDVTWETGGDVETGYPEISWTDQRGTKRYLAGAHTPSQVLWSVRQTQEVKASTDDVAAAPTPHAEVIRILSLLKPTAGETFVDYGCGDGRFVIAAAQIYGCRSVGVEIDPVRAADARRRVEVLGLSDLVTIIEGDATQVDVPAQVGVCYLYPDVLAALRPKLEKLDRFASYMHGVDGLAMSRNGDAWTWRKPQQVAMQTQREQVPRQQYGAVWGGRTYSGPVCNSPGCRMCNSIRSQLRR